MKVAVFTGATGGLGTVCVDALSKGGNWTVFAAGTNEKALEQLGKLPNVIPLKMDVTRQESVELALEGVKSYTDTLDAIVNFAGITAFTSLVEGDSVQRIEKLLSINITGMARVNRAFFELVLKGRGRIINCSSESGWMTPQPFAGPYVLSKYAVEAYSDSLRRELLYLGIPVIKIQPGSFETHITQQVYEQFDRAAADTQYYKGLLMKMKPMMAMELSQKNDPARLVKAVIGAMESKRPRFRYRVGTGRLLALLELLPESGVDFIYKRIFGNKYKS